MGATSTKVTPRASCVDSTSELAPQDADQTPVTSHKAVVNPRLLVSTQPTHARPNQKLSTLTSVRVALGQKRYNNSDRYGMIRTLRLPNTRNALN